MNFSAFKLWREEALRADPGLLDCAETNLYRALAPLQPAAPTCDLNRPVHRCDLARAWLRRYGFSETESRNALVSGGVRHALSLIFPHLSKSGALLWLPEDVYPVYLELARQAEIEPRLFPTLPKPVLPQDTPLVGTAEYLLIANPWKPLGRYLTGDECTALENWLAAAPERRLLIDCVYDLGSTFHWTTLKLGETGRAILLHSVAKGWLWPRTFGVALVGSGDRQLESIFRENSPAQEQLLLADKLLSNAGDVPGKVTAALKARKGEFMAAMPSTVRAHLLIDADSLADGGYFFPVRIPQTELVRKHRILALPASVFGGDWNGSILTSLGPAFLPDRITRDI